MAKRKPRWYFNFRSPYSWLAFRDLTGTYEDVADKIDWVPYWDPDEHTTRLLAEAGGQFLYTPMSKDKHLYILADVRRLAADRGVTVRWPVDDHPVWEVAHLPYFRAAAAGVGRAYADLVYRARFEQGRDISDPAVIRAIGAELGLDRVAVDDELRAQGIEALLESYRDGVFGPPFFVAGRDKYWGVDRLARYAEAVRAGGTREAPAAPTAPVPAGSVGDLGHAGGCG